MISISIFLTISHGEHLVLCQLSICMSFICRLWRKVSQTFCSFSDGLFCWFVFLLLEAELEFMKRFVNVDFMH